MYADDDNSKKTYARVPNVVIEPFRLRDEDLNTQRMLNLMAVGAGNVPLCMHVVTRILREMRISQQNSGQPFKYSQFKATMNKEDLQVAQSVPLQQRLDTLESFMASSAILSKKQKKAMKTTEANNWTPCVSFCSTSWGSTYESFSQANLSLSTFPAHVSRRTWHAPCLT